MPDKNRRILLVGATGMLGQALLPLAKSTGWEVFGLARQEADYCVDIEDVLALWRCLDELQPGVIINAAAITDLNRCESNPGLAYLVNARPVSVFAEYSRQHAAKLVQISTDHFFSGDGDALHDELARVLLLNEYACSKYCAEAFALTAPGSLVVRTNIVGLRGWAGKPTFVEWLLEAFREHQKVTLFDDYFTSSIDVGSFSDALLALISLPLSGVVNLAAHGSFSKLDFALALANRLGFDDLSFVKDSVRSLSGPARAQSLGLNVTKAEKMLGRKLPSLNEVVSVLAQTIQGKYDVVR